MHGREKSFVHSYKTCFLSVLVSLWLVITGNVGEGSTLEDYHAVKTVGRQASAVVSTIKK